MTKQLFKFNVSKFPTSNMNSPPQYTLVRWETEGVKRFDRRIYTKNLAVTGTVSGVTMKRCSQQYPFQWPFKFPLTETQFANPKLLPVLLMHVTVRMDIEILSLSITDDSPSMWCVNTGSHSAFNIHMLSHWIYGPLLIVILTLPRPGTTTPLFACSGL